MNNIVKDLKILIFSQVENLLNLSKKIILKIFD